MRFKHISKSFPYDLLHKQKWIYNDRNKELNRFMSEIIEENYTDGLKFAYSQLLEAIKDKDIEYLEQILEKNLYRRFRSYFIDHQNNIQLLNNKDQIEVSIDQVNIIFGVFLNRNKNPPEIFLSRESKSKAFFDVFFHNQFSIFNIKIPLMQVDVLFKSKRRIEIQKNNEDEDFYSDEDDESLKNQGFLIYLECTHRITFETQQEGYISFFQLVKACYYNTLWKQFIAGENINWVITDIDNSLKGNPFTQLKKE